MQKNLHLRLSQSRPSPQNGGIFISERIPTEFKSQKFLNNYLTNPQPVISNCILYSLF